MENIEIIKVQLKLLDDLPYKTITHFDGKNISQKTYISFDEILFRMNYLKLELSKLGYNYFDGKLIEIKRN